MIGGGGCVMSKVHKEEARALTEKKPEELKKIVIKAFCVACTTAR